MSLPIPKVEIAFSTAPDDPSPNWVDITRWVRAIDGIQIEHGRQDEFSLANENTLGLALVNSDGRFTPGNPNSPYYPNVKKGRMVRVSVTENGVTYLRFTGYVNEWPVTWVDASATVSDVRSGKFASSRMSRLGHTAALRSIVENEILFDGPAAYYPLGEPEGSTMAGNVSTTVQPPMSITPLGTGTTANITFGTGTGPGTDSLSAPQFTRINGTNGAYLAAESATPFYPNSTNGTLVLECFFLASAPQEMGLCEIDGGGSRAYLHTHGLGIDATGHLTGRLVVGATVTYSIASPNSVADGQTHHAALREVQDATGVTVNLVLDGVSVASTFIAGLKNEETYRIFGGGAGVHESVFAGTLSHVAVTWSANDISIARINQHYLAGHTGFSGESSGERLTRLCAYADVPETALEFDFGLSTSLDRQDTTDKTPLQLMQDVVSTEQGILFDAGNGDFYFHDRAHRYNELVSFVIPQSALRSELAPKLDDQGLVNDISASRTGGVAVRAVDNASIADYGTYRQDLQLLTTSDTEVFDAATWALYLHSTPSLVIPVAPLELAGATPAFRALIFGAEISDRITLTGLPRQLGISSLNFFIEGWTETITADSWQVSFYLSNALNATVWQLDSSIYSVLGTTTRLAY